MTLSISDLDTAARQDAPFEFEYLDEKDQPTGVFLQVLGDESPRVAAEIQNLLNADRRLGAQRSMQASKAAETDPPIIKPVEEDVEFVRKSAAVRLVGWRGIKEPYSPELALKLVSINRRLRDQVMAKSQAQENFMPKSPKA